jgi:hypothetical protein
MFMFQTETALVPFNWNNHTNMALYLWVIWYILLADGVFTIVASAVIENLV